MNSFKLYIIIIYLGQKKAYSEVFGSLPRHFSVDDKSAKFYSNICMYTHTHTRARTHKFNFFSQISSLSEANVLPYQLKPVSESAHLGKAT